MESAKPTARVSSELLGELERARWIKDKKLLSFLARANFRCEYCGKDLIVSFEDCFNAQKDHITPKSKGGTNGEENLAAACLTCNALKWKYAPNGANREDRFGDAA